MDMVAPLRHMGCSTFIPLLMDRIWFLMVWIYRTSSYNKLNRKGDCRIPIYLPLYSPDRGVKNLRIYERIARCFLSTGITCFFLQKIQSWFITRNEYNDFFFPGRIKNDCIFLNIQRIFKFKLKQNSNSREGYIIDLCQPLKI